MRQLLPHFLWVGHAGDGRNYKQTVMEGIKAIVQVAAEEPALQPPRDLLYCRFPLLDGAGNDTRQLQLAIVTLTGFLERRVPTLVCCSAGQSRGPAIAAAALSLVYAEPPELSLKRITSREPADVVPGFWDEICRVLNGGCMPERHPVPIAMGFHEVAI